MNEETEINIIRILAGVAAVAAPASTAASVLANRKRKVIRKDKQETKNTVKIPAPVRQFGRVREKPGEVISEE